jgi:hypothetical protein
MDRNRGWSWESMVRRRRIAALHRAAWYAELVSGVVEAIYAWDTPSDAGWIRPAIDPEFDLDQARERLVEELSTVLVDQHRPANLHEHLVDGDPSEVFPDHDTMLHTGNQLLLITTPSTLEAGERRLRAVGRRGKLDQLATDAAVRAHTLLTTGRDPVGGLTLWQDAVRLAAARPGSGLTATTRSLYASLASAAGRTPAEPRARWPPGGRAE